MIPNSQESIWRALIAGKTVRSRKHGTEYVMRDGRVQFKHPQNQKQLCADIRHCFCMPHAWVIENESPV